MNTTNDLAKVNKLQDISRNSKKSLDNFGDDLYNNVFYTMTSSRNSVKSSSDSKSMKKSNKRNSRNQMFLGKPKRHLLNSKKISCKKKASISNREIGTVDFSRQSLDVDYQFYMAGKSSENISKSNTIKKIAKSNFKKGEILQQMMGEETPKPDIFVTNYANIEQETPKPNQLCQDLINIKS